MSLESQPKIPNRIDPVETVEARTKKMIDSTLTELDTQFGAADVNAALQCIFVGDEAVFAPPASLSHLKWKLDALNSDFGEDMVSFALYEADKKRNPPIETAPEPAKDPQLALEAEGYAGEMSKILTTLRNEHEDAYELWGGDDEHYHLDEMPFWGTVEQTDALREQLELLRSFSAVANDASLPQEERTAKLKTLIT